MSKVNLFSCAPADNPSGYVNRGDKYGKPFAVVNLGASTLHLETPEDCAELAEVLAKVGRELAEVLAARKAAAVGSVAA